MSQQQRGPNDDLFLIGFSILLIWGIAALVWFAFRLQLTEFVRWVRVTELWLCKFLVGDAYAINLPDVGPQTVGSWRKWLPGADIHQIGSAEIAVVTKVAVPPLRHIFAALVTMMAGYVMFFGHGTGYRRRMGLEGLMKEQAKSFPVISPFLEFDPRQLPFRVPGQDVPAVLPLFAEALSPEEWVAFHEIGYTGGQLDYNRAYQAMAQQLGKRWQGVNALPLHAQGLFAAFALRAARKRKESGDLLGQMALAWSAERGFHPSIKLKTYIRKVVKDPKLGGALIPFCDLHAFESTAMVRALSRAREQGGVLAPAEFVWLRGHDRNLWYALQNLGRKSYHAEAVGTLVHYTNELIASQKIPTPRFEDAIRGLETYLKSGAAREIPKLDKKAKAIKYWKNKKGKK